MTEEGPNSPNKESCKKPSRFPDVFPNLEAEQYAAHRIHLFVDNQILVGIPDRPKTDDLFERGVCELGIRYVLILTPSEARVHFDEWLIEPVSIPYWRVVFRNYIKDESEREKILAIFNPVGVRKFLRERCVVPDEYLVRGDR